MNILILNHYQRLSPRVALEANTLREAGHEVSVLGWDKAGNTEPGESNGNERWISLRTPSLRLLSLFLLPRIYWAMARQIWPLPLDVIHCTHLIFLPLALLLAKLRGYEVVYDVYERHSLDIANHFGIFKRPVKFLVELLEDRILAPSVQGVLTVDSPGSQIEARYRRRNRNTEVLYNVPTAVRNPDSSDSVEPPNWPSGKRVLIYVGGINRDKGLLRCIEATHALAGQFPDVCLVLVGELTRARAEALSLIERYGLSDKVRIVPWLPYEDMLSYCRHAEVALALHLPLEKFKFVSKGTGRKFFTYMECSLPIVATDFAEVAQTVKEESCGILVDTTNLDSITKAIRYLLEHPDVARDMGKRGRKAIEEKYNWEVETRKLLQVYANLKKASHEVKSSPGKQRVGEKSQ